MKTNLMQKAAFDLDAAASAIDAARNKLHSVAGTDATTDELRELSRTLSLMKRALYERSQAEPAPLEG